MREERGFKLQLQNNILLFTLPSVTDVNLVKYLTCVEWMQSVAMGCDRQGPCLTKNKWVGEPY